MRNDSDHHNGTSHARAAAIYSKLLHMFVTVMYIDFQLNGDSGRARCRFVAGKEMGQVTRLFHADG